MILRITFAMGILVSINSSLAFGQSTCAPEAYYCFNGNAQNEVGNGYHATVSGATLTSGRAGIANTAYNFDSANSALSFSSDSLSSNTFTYAAWVLPTQNPTNDFIWGTHGILNIGNVGGDQYLHLANRGANGIGFCLVSWSVGPVRETVCTGTLPAVNQWYHVAGVRTTDSVKIFVNGKLEGAVAVQVTTPEYTDSTIGKIGARHNNTTPWKGKIDEVAIYKCALTNAEIANLYNSSDFCQYDEECESDLQFCFEGNAQDASGNDFHGTPSSNLVDTTGRNSVSISAYEFSGNNSYVTFPADSFSSHSFTYAAWVNPYSNPTFDPLWGTHGILNIGNMAGDHYLHLANKGNNGMGFCLISWSKGPTRETVCSGSLPTVNQWYHVAGVRSADSMKLYVNGKLEGSAVLNVREPSYTYPINGIVGARLDTTTLWKGIIDEVSVYKCALSASKIEELHNSSPYCSDTINSGDSSGVGIDVFDKTGAFVIYPNPSTGVLTLEIQNEALTGNVAIELLDIKGQLISIQSVGVENISNSVELDFTGVNRGTYFLRVSIGETSLYERVVLQ